MSTITVGLSQGIITYNPSSQIVVDVNAVSTITYRVTTPTATSAPMFVTSSIKKSGADASRVTLPQFTTQYVDHFDVTINNLGAPNRLLDAQVTFDIANTATGYAGGPVIDGGSTIRNKGTSIWVWELTVFLLAALGIGGVLGYEFAMSTAGGSGPVV